MTNSKFSSIYIEIGNECNLKCSFCPPPIRPLKYMSVDEFGAILTKVKPYTETILLHLLGEPLKHPHFAEIIAQCESHALPVTITTNGTLLKKNKYGSLLSPMVRQINFSLQSFADNFNDASPTPYLNQIFSFIKIVRVERPDLYINLRLWDLDQWQQAKEENLPLKKRLEEEFSFDFSKVQIDVRRKKNWKIIDRIYLHFDSRFAWPALDAPTYGDKGRCYGLVKQLGIHADGTVVPCCLDKDAIINLGNIHQNSLEDILRSERAQKIKTGFLSGILIEELCQKCQFITRFSKKK